MSDTVDPLAGRAMGEEVPLPAGNTSGAEVPIQGFRGPEESIPGYRPSGYQDGLERAREYGYQWAAIQDHFAQSTLAALDYGYTAEEIDRHLGFNDPSDFEDRTRESWARQFARDPELLTGLSAPDPKLDLTMNPDVRRDYVDALLGDNVKGPQDFALRYGAAALNAAHELHGVDASDPGAMRLRRQVVANAAGEMIARLPRREDLADATVSLAGGDPALAAAARQRLMDNWADTGMPPLDAAIRAQADPSYLDQIMRGVGKAFRDLGPLGEMVSDLGFGVAAGFAFPDEEYLARYSPDRLAEALRQGPQPNLAEFLSATITHAVLAPGREYARALLERGPEVMQRVLEGKGFTVEEALDLAFLALTPAAGRYPGGIIPPTPEILPPLPRPRLGGPEPGLPGGTGPIIEGEAAPGPLVRLPPPPPLEVIDLEVPLGTPRQLIAPREALGPVPAEDRAITAAAEALSDIPLTERAQKLERLAALELENAAPEGGGTFFQRILQEQIDRGEITRQEAHVPNPEEKQFVVAAGHEPGEPMAPAVPGRADQEPPIPAGKIRLYRVEPQREAVRIPDWVKESPAYQNTIAATGRWFTNDVAELDFYKRQFAEGHRVVYVDIAPGEAEQYRVSKIPLAPGGREVTDNPAAFSQRPEKEFFIPRETAAQKQPLPEPTPQRLTELAEGYDAAKSLFQHFYGIIGETLKDESGALRWRTPDQQAFWDTWARSRDIAHRILIPNIMRGVKNDVQLSRIMDSYRGDIAPYVNEFARASRASDGMAMADSEIGKFLGYVENRTWGGVLRNAKLQPLADALAAIAQHGQAQMQAAVIEGLIDPQAIIDNWYKHLWKNPKGVNWDGLMASHGGSRQGSPSFMRARSLPTMFDGMKAGLSPMFDNPIDQALYGEHLRSHYLNSLRSIKEALGAGEAYWDYGPRTEGDIQLQGVRPDFAGPLGRAPGGNQPPAEFAMQLWGNPGFARPYNNALSQGMNAHPVSASLYNRMLWATNMSTAVKLAWPGFHMRVMGLASLASGIGQAWDEASRGEIFKAFKHLGVAVGPGLATGTVALAAGGAPVAAALAGVVGPAVARDLWVGFRSIYRYNRDINDPIVTALTEAGLRLTPRQHFQMMGSESLMTTAKRGGFIPMQGKWDAVGGLQEIIRTIGRDVRDIGGDPRTEGSLKRLAFAIPRGAGFPLLEAGRIMMTATSPLFDYTIPALRAGALYTRYSSWLETHMNATDAEKFDYARKIVRDGENRFGELNQDTRFAPRLAKQIANVAMVSPGWKWGSWSGFLAAIGQDPERGTRTGKWIGPTLFTSSLVGTLTAFMLQNAVLQVAYGEPPFWKTDTALADLMNGRTGGQSKLGGPARRMDPAEIKEYYDATKVLFTAIYSSKDTLPATAEYVLNAMNPAMHALIGTVLGKDGVSRFARSVYDRPGGLMAFYEEIFSPITLNAILHPPPESRLTPFDRFMGTRDAAQWVTDWAAYLRNEENAHAKTEASELRRQNYIDGITPEKKGRGGGGGRGGQRQNKPTWGQGWYR